MSFSVRQLVGAVIVSFCVGSLMTPVRTQGQSGQAAQKPAPSQPSFMLVEFMNVADGKEADWMKLERDALRKALSLGIRQRNAVA